MASARRSPRSPNRSCHLMLIRLPRCQQDSPDEGPDDLLWNTPASPPQEFYSWIAGESTMVRRLRRILVNDHGVDRRHIAFMSYWRHGSAGM